MSSIGSNPVVAKEPVAPVNKTENKASDKVEVKASIEISKDALKRSGVGLAAGAIPATGMFILGSSVLKAAEKMGDGGLGQAILGVLAQRSVAAAFVASGATSAYFGDGKAGKGALVGAVTGAVTSSAVSLIQFRGLGAGSLPILAASAIAGAVVGAGTGAGSSYLAGKIIK